MHDVCGLHELCGAYPSSLTRKLPASNRTGASRRLLHLGAEPLGVPGVRSVLYFARATAVNASLIARQIKASHRCRKDGSRSDARSLR